LPEEKFFNSRVVSNIEEFKRLSSVIVANRCTDSLVDVIDKLYTRDIFGGDD
jgi:UDPglucose 6-dehydrogenase